MFKMGLRKAHLAPLGVLLVVALCVIEAGRPMPVQAAGGNTTGFAWGENLGWVNFGSANGAVTVSDATVTGYAWSQGFGWVNLGPFTNATGVRNDGAGVLSGYAWSNQLGWLSMSGVRIDTQTGLFVGTANSERIQAGRVAFSCARCRVVTTWRPQKLSASPGPAAGGGPGGGSGTGGAPSEPAQAVAAAPGTLFDIAVKPVFGDRWSWAWLWLLCLVLLSAFTGWIYYRSWRRERRGWGEHPKERPA